MFVVIHPQKNTQHVTASLASTCLQNAVLDVQLFRVIRQTAICDLTALKVSDATNLTSPNSNSIRGV